MKTPFLGLCLFCLFPIAASADEAVVTIKTLSAQMKYDTSDFLVRPGAKVRLTLVNDDELPHNLVITKPVEDKGFALAQTAWALGEKGVEKNWIPDDERVLFATKMVAPHGREELVFDAPKELGAYPYVCTFPGHVLAMHGVMHVLAEGPKLTDGKFQLFLGAWPTLPDFSKLKPLREGALDDNLLQLKFDDYKNDFGVRFTGKLEVKSAGDYSFHVTSDDGSRLSIDGKAVVDSDGSHPIDQVGKVALQPGPHDFLLDYRQGTGGAGIMVSWEGPGFSETWLSKDRVDILSRGRQHDDSQGIPLVPKDEAIIYRNFIQGLNARGIAVGYPGGVNAAFDADICNVGLVWRGGFIDAKRHWTDRGGGWQPPLGYAVVALGKNVPFAILPTADAPWPATPQDIPNGDWPEGYRFAGYNLDKREFPTFRYTFRGIKVEDRLDPSAAPGKDGQAGAALLRVFSLRSEEPPAGLHLRLMTGPNVALGKDGIFPLGEGVSLQAAGTVVRQSQGSQELLIPVIFKEGSARIEVRYVWNY